MPDQARQNEEPGRVPVTDEELALFVGPGYDRYRKKWTNMKNPRKLKIGWNWAAALAGIFWLGYRKMYTYVFLLAGVILAAGILVADPNSSLDAYVGVGFFIALTANWFYCQHAQTRVARIKRKIEEPDLQRAAIERAGGTSWAGVALAVILVLVAAFPSSVKAMLNSYNMVFCEAVKQQGDREPIRPGSVFTPGKVVVRLATGASFGTDQLRAVVYKVEGAKEKVYSWSDYQVEPQWNIIAVPLDFPDSGLYRVEFVRTDQKRIASGRVEIKR